MAKIYDSIEIGLSEPELRQALRAWMQAKTNVFDYRITDLSLHPTSKGAVVRFKVEPELAKADKDALAALPTALAPQGEPHDRS